MSNATRKRKKRELEMDIFAWEDPWARQRHRLAAFGVHLAAYLFVLFCGTLVFALAVDWDPDHGSPVVNGLSAPIPCSPTDRWR